MAGTPSPDARSVTRRPFTNTGLYAQVVDMLGQDIIDGVRPVGSLVFADQLCEQLGVSRSVVREGLRTLSSMGLVEARPQVGTRVLPSERWDLLNPRVVRWRTQGPGYVQQMRELLELRLGIEHVAARLATERISPDKAKQIVDAAQAMRDAFENKDPHAFFNADAEFHQLLLEGTGNAIIAQLADTLSPVLHVRGTDTRPGMHDLTAKSVERHLELAQSLIDGDSSRAQAAALLLVETTLREFEKLQPE